MLYAFTLTIPANTSKANAVTTTARLTSGTLTRAHVTFPAGCAGLVHIAVSHSEHQIIPANPDGDLSGDGFTIEFDEDYEITTAPRTLKLAGWSDDDTYPHTIYFQFCIERRTLRGLLDRLLRGG